jgi:hypothetical protein
MDQHTSAVATAAEIAAADQNGRQYAILAQDSALADIIYRGNTGDELNPVEHVRYTSHWIASFVYCQNAFFTINGVIPGRRVGASLTWVSHNT